MNKRVLWVMTTAMLALSLPTACGGHHDYLGGAYSETKEGVHRIEVSFEGSKRGWESDVLFDASSPTSNSVKLYEYGKEFDRWSGYGKRELRKYVVESAPECNFMNVSIKMQHSEYVRVEPVTVTLRGYVGSQLTNRRVVEFTNQDTNKTIVFNAERIGEDWL